MIITEIANRPIVLGILGALFYALQFVTEKRVLSHKDGSVDKYYLLKNLFVGWGFIAVLVIFAFFESISPGFDKLMDAISYGNLYANPYLFRMTMLASIFAVIGMYIYLVGLKLHDLTQFIPTANSAFLIFIVVFGYFYLEEPITWSRVVGVILAILAIYFLNK